MMMKRTYSLAAALLLACAAASGQNFNPTVEVTNNYQGNSSDAAKPVLEMAVPDSLLRFDLDFDYLVFNKRYEGSYSFKPYMLNMTPEKNAYRGHKLYLKAGAGYSLHPDFDMVFSPASKGGLNLSLYASHKSYFGNYATIKPFDDMGEYRLTGTDAVWKGYDALTTAGFDGRYDWENTTVTFGAGYYGILARDTTARRSYNALDFNARVRSNRTDEKFFFYDVALQGRYGNDACTSCPVNFPFVVDPMEYFPSTLESKDALSEGHVGLQATVGPVFDYFHRALVTVEAEDVTYGGGSFKGGAGRIAVTPRYEMETGRWKFSLGLKLEGLFHQGDTTVAIPGTDIFRKKGKVVYPAVHVDFTASDNVLIYAAATGGSRMNTYSSLIADNHHLATNFAARGNSFMDNSIEVMNVKLGVKGNIARKIQFDIDGGAAFIENGMLESVLSRGPFAALGGTVMMLPAITYQDYNLIYADAMFGLNAGKVRLDAALHYRKMAQGKEADPLVGFRIPDLTGEARFVYDFNSRLYAGLTASGSTARKGNMDSLAWSKLEGVTSSQLPVRIPGFIDLGLIAGYQINRKLGVWAQGGNLLCETIQRNAMYAEKGPWGTVGITLTL